MQGTRSVRIVCGVFAASVLFASGCAGISPEARGILQQPMSCDNAQQDVQELQGSRASGGLRLAQGFQAIAPPMIVLSVLRDIFIGEPFRSVYLDHWRIAFGSYNNRIDARVSELESCGTS
jgi:hypothetical protein